MPISFGDLAGLIAAGAFLLLVIFMAVPLIKLGKVFKSASKTIEELADNTNEILKNASETVEAANKQLEKIDSITSSTAKTVQNVAALSDLYSTALAKPVLSVVSCATGIKNVVKDTTKKVFNVDLSSNSGEGKDFDFKSRAKDVRSTVKDVKSKVISKLPKAVSSFMKASDLGDSLESDYVSPYEFDKDSDSLSDVEKAIVGDVPSEKVEKEPSVVAEPATFASEPSISDVEDEPIPSPSNDIDALEAEFAKLSEEASKASSELDRLYKESSNASSDYYKEPSKTYDEVSLTKETSTTKETSSTPAFESSLKAYSPNVSSLLSDSEEIDSEAFNKSVFGDNDGKFDMSDILGEKKPAAKKTSKPASKSASKSAAKPASKAKKSSSKTTAKKTTKTSKAKKSTTKSKKGKSTK